MNTTSKTAIPRLRYHHNAYQFVFAALRYTQESMERSGDEGDSHISGQQLLEGIRKFALRQFGPMTLTVFRHWGIRTTDDFGRIVFELIERGEMRKTERDELNDFFDLYDFEEVFDREYRVDCQSAFRE